MGWVIIEGFISETSALDAKPQSLCSIMFNVNDLMLVRLHPTRLELISFLRIELKGDVNYIDIYNDRETSMEILNHISQLAKG